MLWGAKMKPIRGEMDTFKEYCGILKDKECIPILNKLIDIKKDKLIVTLWTEKDKDKLFEIRNNIMLLESFKKEIIANSDTE